MVNSLYLMTGANDARPAIPQRRGRGTEHAEEDAMPNMTARYTLPTLQLSDLLRQVLRRVDDWTLIAFNPHYPSPADNR